MSEKVNKLYNTHGQHVFEWVANYIDKDNITEKILYQFDEDSEYYDKTTRIVPFVPIVMNILNKEGRLRAFHLIPRGQKLSPQTFPRYTVDLTDGSYHVNGQMFRYLPTDVQLFNYRLIYFFSPVKAFGFVEENGEMVVDINHVVLEYIRLYKLGLQANDSEGKNYQKVMIWNAEEESISIQDQR